MFIFERYFSTDSEEFRQMAEHYSAKWLNSFREFSHLAEFLRLAELLGNLDTREGIQPNG